MLKNRRWNKSSNHDARHPANAWCVSSVIACVSHCVTADRPGVRRRQMTPANAGVDCSAPILAGAPRDAAKSSPPTPAAPGTPAHHGATCPCKKTAAFGKSNCPSPKPVFSRPNPTGSTPRAGSTGRKGPTSASVSIPNFARTANTIYCAFARLFGATKHRHRGRGRTIGTFNSSPLDSQGYTIIPPSGKLRDLTRQLPHIVQTLGCRILHLLPVHPTPTTYARFGRFGSPYAALDLTAIDPALVEFDHRTTGIDQFCELTTAAHALGARIFLDIVINHTGWGAVLQENHPEFFLRNPDGNSPAPARGAPSGTTWLNSNSRTLCFGTWWPTHCQRGAGVGWTVSAATPVIRFPLPAWQYIIARVQDEFPETIFLLEGLGGSWEATENLLTEGGMQWAYSELFQNYSGPEVAHYLDYALRQSAAHRTLRALQRNA